MLQIECNFITFQNVTNVLDIIIQSLGPAFENYVKGWQGEESSPPLKIDFQP